MSFLPLFQKKERVYENILRFRTLNTHIRTWVERRKEGPGHFADHADINNYVSAKRGQYDAQPLMDTAEDLAREFPRIVAVEVMNAGTAKNSATEDKLPRFVLKDTRPDTDNLLKLLKDVLKGCRFWHDDAQVAEELTRKGWGDRTGIHVRVGPCLNDYQPPEWSEAVRQLGDMNTEGVL